MMRETAYAKLNLALHVRRRREDGYHELETLFAFVDAGDVLTAQDSARDELRSYGEFGSQLTDPFGNIVSKALTALPRRHGWSIGLEKNLPVAAGLGGGSADAAAVFRLVERAQGLPDDWRQRAAKLGADVPACVRSETCIGRGTGTELGPVENDLAGTPVLLLNPRFPLATGPVFQRWNMLDDGPLPHGTAREIALAGSNGLTLAANGLCPVIRTILNELEDNWSWLARMSGSGATCFGLFDSEPARDAAAARIGSEYPGWWQLSGKLR
jgi:4-diphosphocytidyl-2-C-methyl-D-erythritol kinase